MDSVNDNDIPQALIDETLDMYDWVRPICVAMRAHTIPESVIQDSMGYLLRRLDQHLTDSTDLSPITMECMDLEEWAEWEATLEEAECP